MAVKRVLLVALLLVTASGCMADDKPSVRCPRGQDEIVFLDIPFWSCFPLEWRVDNADGRGVAFFPSEGQDDVVIYLAPGKMSPGEVDARRGLEANLTRLLELNATPVWNAREWAGMPAFSTTLHGRSTETGENVAIRVTYVTVDDWSHVLTTTIRSGGETAGLSAENLLLRASHFEKVEPSS